MALQALNSMTGFSLPNMHVVLKPNANPLGLVMSMIDEQNNICFYSMYNLNITVFFSILG